MKINPFNPNSPTNRGMFAGRIKEIHTIEKIVLQTRADKGHGFLLLGQRGIGKTSLLSLVKLQAEGIIDIQGEKANFLVIEVDITSDTNQITLIKKIQLALKRKLARTEKAREAFGKLWQFIGKIEAVGFKVDTTTSVDSEMIFEEFCYSFADTIERITGDGDQLSANYDGILILIDEADKSSPDLDIGTFIKLLFERLQKEGSRKLMIGMAGLPKTKKILTDSHPSSLRILDELNLDRLSEDEIKYVISRVLNHSKELNKFETKIEDEALELLIKHSEGFPHFIHQYGYCAFDLSDGRTITVANVLEGAFGKNGAIEKIGDRYYRDDYYNKIKVESYRQVLKIMATKLDSWVSKSYIKKQFRGKDTTLDNAINALRTRGIILDKEGARGKYRLQDKGFAWWIVMNEEKEKKEEKNK